MIRIETGEVYTAERVRSGDSNSRKWELIVVKNGRDEMTLWLENPGTGLSDGEEFRVIGIKSFTKKLVPYKDGKVCKDRSDRNVEWRVEVTANVTVEPVGFSEMPFGTFSDLPPFGAGENPFANDDLPFEMNEELPL